jgi:hypothetical protein
LKKYQSDFEFIKLMKFRSNSGKKLPTPLCCASMTVVGKRLFLIGGLTSAGPSKAIYEWDETLGWTFFSQILGLNAFDNVIAVPYNNY